MAKSKTKDEGKGEVDESPYAGIKKQLLRYRLFAGLGILLSVASLAGSVAVVIYSGMKSMSAFEDLPKYRINTLALDYRATVKKLDESMAATRGKVEGEPGQRVLQKSRSLVEQMLEDEKAYDQLLQHYADSMALAAEQVGGALEWNRYFQADINTLRDNSQQRQASIQGVFEQFPAYNLATDENQTEASKKAKTQ